MASNEILVRKYENEMWVKYFGSMIEKFFFSEFSVKSKWKTLIFIDILTCKWH